MKSIAIASVPRFDEWREASRECLTQRIAPEDLIWKSVHTLQEDLFDDMGENAEKKGTS